MLIYPWYRTSSSPATFKSTTPYCIARDYGVYSLPQQHATHLTVTYSNQSRPESQGTCMHGTKRPRGDAKQNKGQRQKCLTTCLTQTRPSQPTAFAIASIQFQSIEIYSSQSLDMTRQTRGSGGGRQAGVRQCGGKGRRVCVACALAH